MKRIIKYLNILFLTGLILGCGSDDKTVDVILDSVTSGGVLRTIDIDNNLIYNDLLLEFDEGANYTLTLEEQDNQNGELLDQIEIYARFVENTRIDTNMDGVIDDDDDDLSTEEGLIRTLTASDFQPGERGVPISVITFTADEFLTFTGVDESKLQGKDDFAIRFVLKLKDGRTFSVDDANGNVSGGSYFSSPYTYRTTIGCTITETLAGTYSYEVIDLTSAPGEISSCNETMFPNGEVTWAETEDRGEYTTTDLSFGQFNNCYAGIFNTVNLSKGTIIWDCTKLVADGEIIVEEDTSDEEEFTYTYKITQIMGTDITIDFSNSAGDRGTVVLTRPDSKTWPVLFKAEDD
ncbi:hypothetical protein [Aquimarina algiphila]|uniref:hypothetical protein n=1 Tax=Aquimarina algiphila TaxID=2047982 RepID=UPI00232F3A07|nr:hypothetical protein [Aquimarina algiphila]